MSSLNRVTLIGHLGADPELRYTATGTAVANFRIATSETWSDADGKRQERTEWHRIVVWGKTAESCGEFLSKGRCVCVEGRLQTRSWTDRDGQSRATTEIVATNVTFLGGGQKRPAADDGYAPNPANNDRASHYAPRH